MNPTLDRNRNQQYSIICAICAIGGIYGLYTQDIRAIEAAAMIAGACVIDSWRD